MLRWIIAGLGVVAISVAISSVHMHLSSTPPRPYDAAAYELDRQISLAYEPISIITLLAAPERFDGRKVQVSGFVTLGFEDLGVHLDASSYEAGLHKNALWLHRPGWLTSAAARRLDRRYGEVAGTFEASVHGRCERLMHCSRFSGALTDIRRIKPTFTRSDWDKLRVRKGSEFLAQTLLSGWFLTLVGWTALAMIWLLRRRES
ncbi:MAG: hypothetical protein U1A07_07230 [Phenylobacterium sp.]|nr:hypothetical protein [Phenylobacterium sp.]